MLHVICNKTIVLIFLLFAVQEEVPIVNFATTGIVRCRRCRTYVNPYVTFTDGGRKWRCNICALLNDGNTFSSFHNYMNCFSILVSLD